LVTVGAGVKEPGGPSRGGILRSRTGSGIRWNFTPSADTAVHVVNGQVVNVIRHTAVLEGTPAGAAPLAGGQLQLQSMLLCAQACF